jgi:glycosyltransferase involved in cell wall biosynthesis
MTPNWPQILFYSFCSVTLIQVFYYLFFFTRIAFYKYKAKAVSQTHPVSVVVCARDEAANLTKNLPGILIQKYNTTHEVILVNDNSLDESKYILDAFSKKFRQLHIVELTQEAKHIPGKKFPLSIGIKTAKYETLLLTDADCIPATEFWIDKMQQGYNDQTEIVLGYGAYNKKKGLLNKLIRWEAFHSALQYLSYAQAGLPYMGVGRNLSYKRGVFFRHKGFSAHNHLPSGDDDLFINTAATKKNTEIVIDPDTFTLSEPPKTWSQWVRQKTRHYSTGKYYKAGHKFLLGLYSLTQFLFYPLFAAAILFFNWEIVLGILALKLLVQGLVLYKSTEKLDEKDLFPLFILLDIWMFFYYLIFSLSVFKKPRNRWK